MSEKGFLKHFAVISGGTAFNLFLGLITTPIITRIVDPVENGQHSIFVMYANIAVIILLLGMDQALVRYYYIQEDTGYRRALLFRCIRFPIISTVVVAAIVIFLSITGIVSFEFEPIIMALLCGYTLFQVLYRFGNNVVRLEYKTKLYSMLNIILKASYVGIAVPLLLIIKKNYLLILCIASMMSAMVVFIVSRYSQKSMWNYKNNKDSLCTISEKELIKYAFPLTISMGITYLFEALDKISLNHYCTYAEVGIYASTMTLVNIFAIIQTTFNTLWAPMAIEHYTKTPEDRSFYQKGNQAITIVMFFLGLSLILCKDAFAILLGEKYREAAYILPFLIFHPIMYTISETTVTGITFMKKTKMQTVIAAVACVTNFIGNTLLVPRYGCQGAAISTGLSYIVFFAMRTLISNRYFYVDFKLKKITLLTVASCIYALYNTFVQFNVWSIIGYIICVFLLVVLYKDTVKWGLEYLIKTGKTVLSKRRNS